MLNCNWQSRKAYGKLGAGVKFQMSKKGVELVAQLDFLS